MIQPEKAHNSVVQCATRNDFVISVIPKIIEDGFDVVVLQIYYGSQIQGLQEGLKCKTCT